MPLDKSRIQGFGSDGGNKDDGDDGSSFWGALDSFKESMTTPGMQSAMDSLSLHMSDVATAASEDVSEMTADLQKFVMGGKKDGDSDDEPAYMDQNAAPGKVEVHVSSEARKEASELIGKFCDNYPAYRVAPTKQELIELWGKVDSLHSQAIAAALYEQLSWTSGELAWQPRLRVLHILEFMYAQGGMGKDVSTAVVTQACGLIQHLAQPDVPQCEKKATAVLAIIAGRSPSGEDLAVAPVASAELASVPVSQAGKLLSVTFDTTGGEKLGLKVLNGTTRIAGFVPGDLVDTWNKANGSPITPGAEIKRINKASGMETIHGELRAGGRLQMTIQLAGDEAAVAEASAVSAEPAGKTSPTKAAAPVDLLDFGGAPPAVAAAAPAAGGDLLSMDVAPAQAAAAPLAAIPKMAPPKVGGADLLFDEPAAAPAFAAPPRAANSLQAAPAAAANGNLGFPQFTVDAAAAPSMGGRAAEPSNDFALLFAGSTAATPAAASGDPFNPNPGGFGAFQGSHPAGLSGFDNVVNAFAAPQGPAAPSGPNYSALGSGGGGSRAGPSGLGGGPSQVTGFAALGAQSSTAGGGFSAFQGGGQQAGGFGAFQGSSPAGGAGSFGGPPAGGAGGFGAGAFGGPAACGAGAFGGAQLGFGASPSTFGAAPSPFGASMSGPSPFGALPSPSGMGGMSSMAMGGGGIAPASNLPMNAVTKSHGPTTWGPAPSSAQPRGRPSAFDIGRPDDVSKTSSSTQPDPFAFVGSVTGLQKK